MRITYIEPLESAIKRMKNALENYVILGIKTQIPFLKAVIEHPQFVNGNTNTNFLNEYFSNWKMPDFNQDNLSKVLAVAAIHAMADSKKEIRVEKQSQLTPWNTVGQWEMLSV